MLRHKTQHREVELYMRDANGGLYAGNLTGQLRDVCALLDRVDLERPDRRWLNKHRKRLEDTTPRYAGPGRPTQEAQADMAVRRALHNLKKVVDEAETRRLNGGHHDGRANR